MNIGELENAKIELEKQKKQNNDQIAISDKKIKMSKVNSLGFKNGTIMVFSATSYILLLLTSTILAKFFGTGVITNIFPGFTYPIALVGSSLGIGAMAKTLIYKKFQIKEKSEKFSTAKTSTDKLEEEIHYQIELEKAKNRNRAIDETIKAFNTDKTTSKEISICKTIPQTKKEAEAKVKEISAIIKEQYDKLDILTTQKVLHDRFCAIRQKFQEKAEVTAALMISGLLAMLPTVFFPKLMIKGIMPASSVLEALTVSFVPFVAGAIGGGIYAIKRNKDYKKAFDSLNAELGEDALDPSLDKKYKSAYEEQQEIEKSIENQIRNISLAEVKLVKNKRYINAFMTEENINKDIQFQDYPKLHITEEMMEDVLEYTEMYEKYEQSEEEILKPVEEKNHTLVKKRISEKNLKNK